MKTVILCGGAGTRLWPISRQKSPKQFAQIFDNESLFEKTISRNKNLSDSFCVVVNETQLPLCKSQIADELLMKTQFLIETKARNTAPAIALAALASSPEEILLVLPSDHLVKDFDLYNKCITNACELAEKNKLVTFGIEAKYPETGFGYIEADGEKVKSFKEKPDLATAEAYIKSGNFFWNSGMFCFKAGVFLDELKKYSPEIFQACLNTYKAGSHTENLTTFSSEDMLKIPSNSIDYAVMEKSQNVCVVPSYFYWSDLGSFDALYGELAKDEDQNTISEKHISFNSKNNLVLAHKKIIATFDIEDLVIVETEDAILIGKRGKTQNVKQLLEKVKLRFKSLLD